MGLFDILKKLLHLGHKTPDAEDASGENMSDNQGPTEEVKEPSPSPALDFHSFIRNERISLEHKFNSQPENHRFRISPRRLMRLGRFLNAVYGIDPQCIGNTIIVVDGLVGKTANTLPTPQDYDLTSDFVSMEGNVCKSKGAERNVMLQIDLLNAQYAKILLHMRITGILGESAYFLMHLSVMMVMADGKTHWDLKYLMFDSRLPNPIIDEINEIRERAIKKHNNNIVLTEEENSSIGMIDPVHELGHGVHVMREKRWGDAVSILTDAYKFVKPFLNRNEKDENLCKFMKEISEKLSICYTNIGLYDMALYYAEFAQSFSDKLQQDMVYASLLAKDVRALHVLDNSVLDKIHIPLSDDHLIASKFGLVLQSCFYVHPSELSDMLIVKDSKVENAAMVTEQRKIWEFDFIEAIKDCDSLTAYISYRSYRSKADPLYCDHDAAEGKNDTIPYTSPDKSKRRVDNEIIAYFEKVTIEGAEYVKMRIMIPEFQLSSNNNEGMPVGRNLLFAVKNHLSIPLFEDIREEARKKISVGAELSEIEYYSYGDLTEARYNLVIGIVAWNNEIWGDALFHLTKAHRIFATELLKGNDDRNSVAIVDTLCFKIGYIYCEYKLFEQAVSYLGRIQNILQIDYQQEYINSLCNSADYRALDFIKSRIDSFPATKGQLPEDIAKSYIAFLQRRYAYCLIDKGRIKEATEFLNYLLGEDERTREFAKSELEYLRVKYNI